MCRRERGIRWRLDEVDRLQDTALNSRLDCRKRENTSETSLVNKTSSFIDNLYMQFVRLGQRERWREEYPETEDGHGGDRQGDVVVLD